MAGDWIKVLIDLRNSPEVIFLSRELQSDPDLVVGKLVRLWSWANVHTADGNVPGVTGDWVDVTLGVDGLALLLEKCGWLRITSGGITIPDFQKHNGQSAKQRALTARRVALHRNRKRNAPNVTREEKSRVERSGVEKKREEETVSEATPPRPAAPNGVDEVVAHYLEYHSRARPGEKERKKIKLRLKEGYTVENLKAAIDGCHRSPHHCGANDNGTKYQSLELIMRDSKHVHQFMEVPSEDTPLLSPASERALGAVDRFARRHADE